MPKYRTTDETTDTTMLLRRVVDKRENHRIKNVDVMLQRSFLIGSSVMQRDRLFCALERGHQHHKKWKQRDDEKQHSARSKTDSTECAFIYLPLRFTRFLVSRMTAKIMR